jgi:hypothetical protein
MRRPVKETNPAAHPTSEFLVSVSPASLLNTRIQVVSLRANDLCFRAGSAIDDGARHEAATNRRVIDDLYRQHAPPRNHGRDRQVAHHRALDAAGG